MRNLENKKNIEDEQQMFKYLDKSSNNILSEFNGLDLQELLDKLNYYYIFYRKKLGVKKDVTFGLEIEFEYSNILGLEEEVVSKLNKNKILKKLIENNLQDYWNIKNDDSLLSGNEITSPILRDKEKAWKELKQVLEIANKYGKIIKESAGHIHVGAQLLGENTSFWTNFAKIWSVYENVIYRFLYGEYLSPRPYMNKYAKPISNTLWEVYKKTKNPNYDLSFMINELSFERHQAINFNNVCRYDKSFHTGNTIEFRCPNGSLDSTIWQNNVNLILKLLLYCISPKFNHDTIDKRHNQIDGKYNDLSWYNEIYLDQALELVDLIFTNNLDKINFLKQYLKSFETVNVNKYAKVQKFTK